MAIELDARILFIQQQQRIALGRSNSDRTETHPAAQQHS
jgi:hypothetical protein